MKPEDVIRLKELLPTTLGSDEIREQLAGDILRRSIFSARMASAPYLAKIREVCTAIAAGSINAADARAQLLPILEQMGHSPQDEGGLRNPASIRRLNLILDTQTQMASSVARLSEQTEATINLFPAWELTRLETRSFPRADWMQRWTAAGNSVNWEGAVKRQMIALKSSPIWAALGNGAGGFYVDKVLKPLGADTEGSRYLDPDGSFPNHIPNPEDKKAMEAITESVNLAKADLGIIFDTDVDRAGAVLSDGSELNRNRIIAMLAAILLREHPGTTIVTDSITSTGLAKFIAEKGGVHHRFKRGYRNVINESIRLNKLGQDSQLAIETSGHGAFKENYFLDDGAYIVTKLLIELARGKKEGYTLESLIASLEEPAESVEFRMNILLEEFKPYGQQVIDDLTAYASAKEGWSLAPSNFEGVRVNLDADRGNGWFLLRLSLHDPLLPLNIESNSQGGAKKIAQELAGFIRGYDKLDASKFLSFAE